MESWQQGDFDRRKKPRKAPPAPLEATVDRKPRITVVGLRNATHRRLCDYCMDRDLIMTDAATEAVEQWLEGKVK